MKAKRFFLLGSILLILVLAVLPLVTACSTTDTDDTSTTDTTTTDTTTGDTTTTEAKTLKVGYIGWLGFFIGLDGLSSSEILVEMINQEGGLDIGGEKYTIELISYDSNNDQATAVAAANKLIFEDDVKFIISDGFGTDAIISIAEANEVVLCAADQSTTMFDAANQYSFNTANAPQAIMGWFADNYPDMNSIVIAVPDSQTGQNNVAMIEPALIAFGFDYTFEYYPADATDLSSLGTKVNALNPDVFAAMGGTYQPYAAVWQAGYRGLLFSVGPLTTSDLLTQLTVEQLEGFVGAALPTEFEPSLTDTAEDFKAAWIATNGSWTEPQTLVATCFSCLVAALEEAGTLDTTEVAEVIASGLKFDTAMGEAQMFSRPDLGIDRTVDCLAECFVKEIVNGESVLIATVTVDEILAYFQQIYEY